MAEHCASCGHKLPVCRRCSAPLTPENARKSRGRYIGACRACEATEAASRYERKDPANAR